VAARFFSVGLLATRGSALRDRSGENPCGAPKIQFLASMKEKINERPPRIFP
jgi:hypothetical protein